MVSPNLDLFSWERTLPLLPSRPYDDNFHRIGFQIQALDPRDAALLNPGPSLDTKIGRMGDQ